MSGGIRFEVRKRLRLRLDRFSDGVSPNLFYIDRCEFFKEINDEFSSSGEIQQKNDKFQESVWCVLFYYFFFNLIFKSILLKIKHFLFQNKRLNIEIN